MPWSILTPDVCAHWDGHVVSFTPGIGKADAPSEDRLEEIWRRYYAGILDPARLKVNSRNLAEASTITEPQELQKPPQPAMKHKQASANSLAVLPWKAPHCRDSHLFKYATQTLFASIPQPPP